MKNELFRRILSWGSILGLLLFFPIYDSLIAVGSKLGFSLGVLALFVAAGSISFLIPKKDEKDMNQLASSGLGIGALGIYFLRSYLEDFALQKGGAAPVWISSVREFLLVILVLFVLGSFFLGLLREWERESLGAQSSLKSSKQGLIRDFLLGTGILLLIIILANYVSTIRNHNFDLSSHGQFSFSLEAKKLLKQLPEGEIDVIAFYPRPLESSPSSDKSNSLALRRIRPDLEILLGQLTSIHPAFKVKFINADVELDELADFGQVSNGIVLVRFKKKGATAVEKFPEQRISVKDKSDLEDFERKFVQAVVNVTTNERKIYFTESNGERYSQVFQNLPNERLNRLSAGLAFLNFKVFGLGFKDGWPPKVPDNADLLAITGPTVPFGPEARAAILDYVVKRNGKVLITIEPKGGETFDWLLQEAGYSFIKTGFSQVPSQPGVIVTKSFRKHPIEESLSKKDLGVVFPYSGYFEAKVAPGNKKEFDSFILLESGGDAYLDPNQNGKQDPGEEKKNLPIGLVLQTIQKTETSPADVVPGAPPIPSIPNDSAVREQGRIVIYSGTSWLTDQYLPFAANYELASSSTTWMYQNLSLPAIAPKKEEIQTVSLTDGQKRAVWILGMFVFPGLIAGLGSIYVIRRRKIGRKDEN
ncbi:putative membrane protein [Leptospira broomii serovar Hurstbridge str. 5399]|uniref:Membrane protein n=1 Tax=Leptospira broomii serovar Hurstbridge str. 5399 TaxID=1049789 RepID=T0F1Z9_9LEPT|nr:Gldg family protein [Leptospira broomii]EQA45115.1 putative membrane protein [Leptospira broomii serovar Hurstbridge str. 5399]